MQDWIDTIARAIQAIGIVVVLWQQWRSRQRAMEIAANVLKIELATNSMKDALVASTAKASELEGAERGRQEEVVRQDAAKTT